MRADKLASEIAVKTGIKKIVLILLSASICANLLMAIGFLTFDKTVRTQIVPPIIKQSFWMDGKQLGPEYLEEMGAWLIQQYATVTPYTIDHNIDVLLRYIQPIRFAEVERRWRAGAQQLKHNNISKVFFPSETRLSQQGQALALIGREETWVGDKKLPNVAVKSYMVAFEYDGQNTTISELRESDPRHPFAPMKSKDDGGRYVVETSIDQRPDTPPDSPSESTNQARSDLPPGPSGPVGMEEVEQALQLGKLPQAR